MELFDSSSELSRLEEDDEVKTIISNIGRSKLLVHKPINSNLLVTEVQGKTMETMDLQQEYEVEGGPVVGVQEKRIRREIANSNERRRMQSINSGFSSLRTLLPHHEGEKLSKAAILQQTAEYIYSLEQEKTRLLSQNCQLKRLLGQTQQLVDTDETDSGPAPKRRLIDNGQKVMLEEEGDDLSELQVKLERERRTRMALEERLRQMENDLYQSGGDSEKIVRGYSTEERMIEQTQTVTVTQEQMDSMVNSMNIQHQQQQQQQQQQQHHHQQQATVLTPAAKKQGGGVETLVLESGKLPSIIQCAMKGEGRVEVEQIPRITEIPGHDGQAVEIASVQDPETGATRQYIVTQMCDSTSKQNLETIVEAIRHLEGDHLFSEESGPHQVVKEEVVESCIIEDNGNVMEVVTLPNNQQFSHHNSIPTNIINSLPQVPVSTYQLTLPTSLALPLSATLPTVPVTTFQQQAGSGSSMVPVSVSNLVSSLQQPLAQTSFLQQVPVMGHTLPPVSTISSGMPSLPIELAGNIGPPQTSPVNLELGLVGGGHSSQGGSQCSGSLTPNSELSNSPPQSSPVNLAQPVQMMEH